MDSGCAMYCGKTRMCLALHLKKEKDVGFSIVIIVDNCRLEIFNLAPENSVRANISILYFFCCFAFYITPLFVMLGLI